MVDLPNPETVANPGQRFVGLAERYDMSRRGEIPALYERFFAGRDGIEGAVDDVLYGLSFDTQPDGTFRYAVAIEVPAPGAKPEGFCDLETSAGPYAVFRLRTPVSELPAHFDAIFNAWLPAAPYALRKGAIFERYPEDDAPEAGTMLYEIWVPVTPG